ncbi:uncharacterized protein [Anabrus simplex]|uniref:uncharacterized protein isoform X2 n=1 Tax=Anabrus simplex TaxID=316456 RepID=UPI0035A2AA8F
MDAGAWCAGLPMARWSKCYYPRGVMQLFGEGPHDVTDKINSPIISKKRRNLKILCSSLIFILLVVAISLMVFFIIEYKDNSTTLSANTAITKNVNVMNTITIFTTGNRTSSSNTTEGAGNSRLDVNTVVHSLERTRWFASTGENALLAPSVTKETSEAGGNSTGDIPNETKQDQSDISVEVLGTHNETKVAITLTLNYHQDTGTAIEGDISNTVESEEVPNAGGDIQTTPSDRTTSSSDYVQSMETSSGGTGCFNNGTRRGSNAETKEIYETKDNGSRVARMEGQINVILAENNTSKTQINENNQAAFAHNIARVNNETALASDNVSKNIRAASVGGNSSDHKAEVVASGNSSAPDGDENGSTVNKHLSSLFYSSLPIFNKIHDVISQW